VRERVPLGKAGALVVAEPTGNMPLVGHKGALWLEATTKGVTAYGSMPEKGVNAVYKAARAVTALQDFDFNVARHGVLGGPTLNVGTMHGGININSVPDRAAIGIDIRTIPGQVHARIRDQLAAYLGSDVLLSTLLDAQSVWTDPNDDWTAGVMRTACEVADLPDGVDAAPYFTDASVLMPALGNPPTAIVGPGELALPHQIYEYCFVSRIEQAVEIYTRLTQSWCGI
jgi:succinyl-diaminopimelate desuccinylase